MEDNISTENELTRWLKRIGFDEYVENFKNEGFEDLETVAFTFRTDSPETRDLLTKMNITKLGHQQSIVHKAQHIALTPSSSFGEPRSKKIYIDYYITIKIKYDYICFKFWLYLGSKQ
jgi:hypothetical protein